MRLLAAILALVMVLAAGGSKYEGVSPAALVDATDVTGASSTNGVVSLATVRAAAPHAVVSVLELTLDGARRAYVVVTPASDTRGLPQLVVLHGVNASVTQEIIRDEFLPLVSAGKAVLVYPAAYHQVWDTVFDDDAFVATVTQNVHAALHTGPVDLVGYSDGGKMAYHLQCQAPRVFAAMAVIAAVPTSSCGQPTAIPILIGAGTADPDVTPTVVSTTVMHWRAVDHVASAPVTTKVGAATVQNWGHVEQISWAGLTHMWPRSPEYGAAAAAGALIWAFLSDHQSS